MRLSDNLENVRRAGAGIELEVGGGSLPEVFLRRLCELVDDAECVFHPERAGIVDERQLVVWLGEVAEPVADRYAFTNAPEASLYSASGLQYPPFGRTTGKSEFRPSDCMQLGCRPKDR